MHKRALLYTLEFNGELVHSVGRDFKVKLQKDHVKGQLNTWQHNCYDEPEVCQDTREVMTTFFENLNNWYGRIDNIEDCLQRNKYTKKDLEDRLIWLKSFVVIKWTMDPSQPRHLQWKDEAAYPWDFSPSYAKCIKNIEKVLS